MRLQKPHVKYDARKLGFSVQCYANVVYAVALYLSVNLSVISRCSTNTAKRRIMETMPYDSLETLVSDTEDLGEFEWGDPSEGIKYRWVG